MSAPGISSRNLLLVNIALSVVFIIIQTLFLVWLGIPTLTAVIDSSVNWILLCIISIATGNVLRYYRPDKSRFFYVFIWDLVISGVWLFLVNQILTRIIPDTSYLTFLAKSLPVRFFIVFLVTGWFSMISWVVYAFEEQQKNEKRKGEAEKLAKEAELFKLRKQFQPHFLFNSLNSINALIGSKPEEARNMVQQLADFLRGAIRNEEELQITFEEELKYLQLYLNIEKVRFGHRLNTQVEYDETCLKALIPQLILQPVVENAIKFGLYDTTGDVLIKITANVETQNFASLLVVSVQNPFDPSSSISKKGTGFGLNSISRRLYLFFGRNDLLETKSIGNEFITTIKIPQL